jgi:hypothetical protein
MTKYRYLANSCQTSNLVRAASCKPLPGEELHSSIKDAILRGILNRVF